jgi:lysophospholipid hydrolase
VPLGETLFERGKFDGSLLVVVSGRIQCRFHEYPLQDDGEFDYEENILGFTSGPGDVVTPLLGLLSALVWAQQAKDNPESGSSHPQEPLAIASGVSAIATAENTRLIRIPPTCFAHVLEKFPSNVYRVAQTILCRTQRVTLKTLVKTLGLHKDLIVGDASLWEGKDIKEKRLQMPEWRRIETALQNNADSERRENADLEAIRRDAAIVTAFELNAPFEEAQLITDNSSVISMDAGETLVHTGLTHDAIYLLLSGSVEIGAMVRRNYYNRSQSPYFYRYHNVEAGTVLGRLSCFAGGVSMIEARARRESEGGTGCILLKVPKSVFDDLVVRYPRSMIRCMHVILGLISPVVHLLISNSEWLLVEPSEAIAHKGDRCDAIFMVLNGRFRASHKNASMPSSVAETVEEYGRGKFIGEVGLIDSCWPHDVYALRNSELVRVPMNVLLSIIRAYPISGVHFAAVIASQVQNKLRHRRSTMNVPSMKSLASSKDAPPRQSNALAEMPSYGLNLATIAVVPLYPLVVAGFCSEFASALNEIAPAALLEKSDLRKVVGEKTFQPKNAMHEMKMTRFLGDMEEKYRLVVYRADVKYTWWTQLAITQADCILLLVRADEIPEKQQVEQCLAWAHESKCVRIELVIISEKANSDEEYRDVREEVDDWTENREWVTGSQRIRLPFDHHGLDFERMCRRITGRSVGLALGGGGARGIAHLGIIRALMEAVNVPSMGDISDTLRWVSSYQHRKQVVNDADLYLYPPVGGYGTLEYDKFDEIMELS